MPNVPVSYTHLDVYKRQDDLFFHVLSDRILILFDDLWFKLPFPVSWDINLHIAVAGMHGLLGMAVSTVVCFFVTVIILGVSKFLIHFLIEGTFQYDTHHVTHNRIDICAIFDLDVVLFEITAHEFPHCRFLWCVISVSYTHLSFQAEAIDSSIFKIIKRVEVQPDGSLRFELINNAIVLQYPEIKTKDKKSKNIPQSFTYEMFSV